MSRGRMLHGFQLGTAQNLHGSCMVCGWNGKKSMAPTVNTCHVPQILDYVQVTSENLVLSIERNCLLVTTIYSQNSMLFCLAHKAISHSRGFSIGFIRTSC